MAVGTETTAKTIRLNGLPRWEALTSKRKKRCASADASAPGSMNWKCSI